MRLLRHWKLPLLVSVLLALLYVHYFENRAMVEVELQVSQTTWFKIYWAEEGKLFSKKHMARVRVRPEQHYYRMFLTDLRKIEKLRIDPHQYVGKAVIKKMVIRQNGMQVIRFAAESDFARLEPLFQVEQHQVEEEGFTVMSSGQDPQFEFFVDLKRGETHFLLMFVRIAAILIAVFAFFYFTGIAWDEKQLVPIAFTAVFILVIVMASSSARNVHPDEYVHLDASRYYMTNWLPPAVDDPSIRHTYSVYGVSRLNSREVAYFFSGKLAQIIAPLRLPDYLGLRMFNVLLFGLMVLYVFRREQARLVAVPFLLSPQLWYVFSYCGSDAFALFTAFIVGCQLVLPDSMLNSYLAGKSGRNRVVRLVLLGFLCSMLLLLKKNYYFYILFILGYFLWRVVFYKEQGGRMLFFRRIAVVVLIGISLTGLRITADYAVNGLDRSMKIAELREELAKPLYKPSTPLEKKHIFLYRKARGHPLEQLVRHERWFEKTFRSAFGMYGYFTVSASDAYYDCVRWTGTIFLLFFICAVLARGAIPGNLLMLLFFTCAGGSIAASLWHSWTADFQTQGRYLFPIMSMLGILMFHTRRYIPADGVRLCLVTMFMLSLYSFIYVALLKIPKAVLEAPCWLS